MNKIVTCAICVTSLVLGGCLPDSVGPTAAGSWFNHDRRTASTIVDDQAITVKANMAIAKDKAVWKDSHISTLSYNNSLLLVGQTKNRIYKDQLEKILAPISGIGNIYNQVTIGEPIPLKVRANDTWITTQVKAKIVTNRDIGINRVKVITENGTVYLMGMLTSDEERIVTDMVRRVSGVQKVVTVIERAEGAP